MYVDIDSELSSILELKNELQRHIDIYDNIVVYGSSLTTLSLLKSQRLLSSSSTHAIAIEQFKSIPTVDLDDLALEGILSSIVDKYSLWKSKLEDLAENGLDKVISDIEPIYNNAIETIQSVIDSGVTASNEISKTVKAHPYKTIVVAVTTIATVIGIVMFVTRGFPNISTISTNFSLFTKKLRSLVISIRSPFNQTVSISKTTGIPKVVVGRGPDPIISTIGELGYTRASLINIVGRLRSLWRELLQTIGSFKRRIVSVVRQVLDKGARTLSRKSAMGDNFVMRAQALDNMSHSPLSFNNKFLTLDEWKRIPENILSVAHNMAMKGKLVFSSKFHTKVTTLGNDYQIQIVRDLRDKVGRIASSVTEGSFKPGSDPVAEAQKIIIKIKSFHHTVDGSATNPEFTVLQKELVRIFSRMNKTYAAKQATVGFGSGILLMSLIYFICRFIKQYVLKSLMMIKQAMRGVRGHVTA